MAHNSLGVRDRLLREAEFRAAKDRSREAAMDVIRGLARPLPPGFEFDRDDANQR